MSSVGVHFAPIAPQPADLTTIVVPEGYGWAPLLRWGDPLRADGPAFDVANQTAAKQAQQIGYNCDYIGWHQTSAPGETERGLLWVNHEYTNPELMFVGFEEGNPTREQTDIQMEAHGGAIVELIRNNEGRLVVDLYSPLNRRITATTPMVLSGPAAGHDLLKTASDPWGTTAIGMLNNCAGGRTPWGTVLTCEENFQGYFGWVSQMDPDDPRKAVHERYGIEDEASGYAWENHYPRFDVTVEPNEPFRFGWVVEIDPFNPDSVPVKRTALGRFRHEGATFGYSPSGRVVFYSGDDARFEYIYKYVSTNAYDPLKRGMGQDVLDNGVLYVARLNDDGTGVWMPLIHGENGLDESNGFDNQGDVLIKTRLAADLLGATRMDRPEDIQQNPVNHKVYAAMTNNTERADDDLDPANPRPENRWGHIVEITEADDDAASTTFTWDLFLICGDPSDESTYFAGAPRDQVSPIACPDNVNFDDAGNLWISTDGQPGALELADALHCVPTMGPQRGMVSQFLAVVGGAECASFEFTNDNVNLVVSVQHPGEGGTVDDPLNTWPDGYGVARPTVIQVWKNGGGPING
jgi:secreted PhoX family phosphatase